MSEAAVGPVALGAAKAQAALAQAGDILSGDGVIGQQAGQQQVKNGALGVHHAAGQAAHRHTVQIADQEHGTGQHGRAVGNNFSPGVPDGQRGAVVGVHAHAAGGEDQLTACGLCFQNGGRDARRVIVADLVEGHLTAIHRQLLLEDGSKLVLNAALEHLTAGGDDAHLLGLHGQHVQDRLCPGSSLQLAMNIACLKYRMTPEEVLTAVTLNAAAAIGRAGTIGSVEPGKQADLLLWNAPDLDYVCYRFGSNLVGTVMKKGRIVHEE